MKVVFVAVGGTGARVARSLVNVLSVGMCNRRQDQWSIYQIDIDQAAPAKGQLNADIDRYNTIAEARGWNKINGDPSDHQDRFYDPAKFILAQQGGSVQAAQQGAISLGNLLNTTNNPVTRGLLGAFFRREDLEVSIAAGLYQKAHMGAALFEAFLSSRPTDANAEPSPTVSTRQRSLRDVFKQDEGIEARFIVCGSLFGGTGASAIPAVTRMLTPSTDKKRWSTTAVLVTPYLTIPSPDVLDDKQVKDGFCADNATLVQRSRLALGLYSQLLGKTISSCYVIGSRRSLELKKWANGGMNQNNPPHTAEVLGALAALDSVVREQASNDDLAVQTGFAPSSPEQLTLQGLPPVNGEFLQDYIQSSMLGASTVFGGVNWTESRDRAARIPAVTGWADVAWQNAKALLPNLVGSLAGVRDYFQACEAGADPTRAQDLTAGWGDLIAPSMDACATLRDDATRVWGRGNTPGSKEPGSPGWKCLNSKEAQNLADWLTLSQRHWRLEIPKLEHATRVASLHPDFKVEQTGLAFGAPGRVMRELGYQDKEISAQSGEIAESLPTAWAFAEALRARVSGCGGELTARLRSLAASPLAGAAAQGPMAPDSELSADIGDWASLLLLYCANEIGLDESISTFDADRLKNLDPDLVPAILDTFWRSQDKQPIQAVVTVGAGDVPMGLGYAGIALAPTRDRSGWVAATGKSLQISTLLTERIVKAGPVPVPRMMLDLHKAKSLLLRDLKTRDEVAKNLRGLVRAQWLDGVLAASLFDALYDMRLDSIPVPPEQEGGFEDFDSRRRMAPALTYPLTIAGGIPLYIHDAKIKILGRDHTAHSKRDASANPGKPAAYLRDLLLEETFAAPGTVLGAASEGADIMRIKRHTVTIKGQVLAVAVPIKPYLARYLDTDAGTFVKEDNGWAEWRITLNLPNEVVSFQYRNPLAITGVKDNLATTHFLAVWPAKRSDDWKLYFAEESGFEGHILQPFDESGDGFSPLPNVRDSDSRVWASRNGIKGISVKRKESDKGVFVLDSSRTLAAGGDVSIGIDFGTSNTCAAWSGSDPIEDGWVHFSEPSVFLWNESQAALVGFFPPPGGRRQGDLRADFFPSDVVVRLGEGISDLGEFLAVELLGLTPKPLMTTLVSGNAPPGWEVKVDMKWSAGDDMAPVAKWFLSKVLLMALAEVHFTRRRSCRQVSVAFSYPLSLSTKRIRIFEAQCASIVKGLTGLALRSGEARVAFVDESTAIMTALQARQTKWLNANVITVIDVGGGSTDLAIKIDESVLVNSVRLAGTDLLKEIQLIATRSDSPEVASRVKANIARFFQGPEAREPQEPLWASKRFPQAFTAYSINRQFTGVGGNAETLAAAMQADLSENLLSSQWRHLCLYAALTTWSGYEETGKHRTGQGIVRQAVVLSGNAWQLLALSGLTTEQITGLVKDIWAFALEIIKSESGELEDVKVGEVAVYHDLTPEDGQPGFLGKTKTLVARGAIEAARPGRTNKGGVFLIDLFGPAYTLAEGDERYDRAGWDNVLADRLSVSDGDKKPDLTRCGTGVLGAFRHVTPARWPLRPPALPEAAHRFVGRRWETPDTDDDAFLESLAKMAEDKAAVISIRGRVLKDEGEEQEYRGGALRQALLTLYENDAWRGVRRGWAKRAMPSLVQRRVR